MKFHFPARRNRAFTRIQWLFIVLLGVVAFEGGMRLGERKSPEAPVKPSTPAPKPTALKMPQQPLIESALKQEEDSQIPMATVENTTNIVEAVPSEPVIGAPSNAVLSKSQINRKIDTGKPNLKGLPAPTTRRTVLQGRNYPVTAPNGPFTSPPPQDGVRVVVP